MDEKTKKTKDRSSTTRRISASFNDLVDYYKRRPAVYFGAMPKHIVTGIGRRVAHKGTRKKPKRRKLWRGAFWGLPPPAVITQEFNPTKIPSRLTNKIQTDRCSTVKRSSKPKSHKQDNLKPTNKPKQNVPPTKDNLKVNEQRAFKGSRDRIADHQVKDNQQSPKCPHTHQGISTNQQMKKNLKSTAQQKLSDGRAGDVNIQANDTQSTAEDKKSLSSDERSLRSILKCPTVSFVTKTRRNSTS